MDRVASTLRKVGELCDGRLTPANATEAIGRIAEAPPAAAWLFALAAGVGAVALAVLFGVRHLTAATLIFGSAAAGAAPRIGALQHQYLSATIQRGATGWRRWSAGSSV